MKYVLRGNLSPEWASKQSERVGNARAKLDKLGIKVESIHYTQGCCDFVDTVDACYVSVQAKNFRGTYHARICRSICAFHPVEAASRYLRMRTSSNLA